MAEEAAAATLLGGDRRCLVGEGGGKEFGGERKMGENENLGGEKRCYRFENRGLWMQPTARI
jgi:hypothetical protein